ncbi:conjugal transfer protein TraF [Bacteroidales bacterium OttesenSCG-928-B11]|nr:conjugal transfer protein TraF [Bacteroidales bacterium OttesenSCG-928-C03]MDL2311885.1 conjugal transfer protein TraF [Bacteroidales bacterium OttesenSCG-928-B11]MDL2326158.1 conjugal transfer protein TraF [Bacteroidales bacterium OttesenSCG-928-A14]
MKKICHDVVFLIITLCLIACGNNETTKTAEYQDVIENNEFVEIEKTAVLPKENLSGELIVLSEEEFEAQIADLNNPKGYKYKGYTPCVIDFYADWCGPCHAMNPILIELAEEYKGKVIFYKINSDKSPNSAKSFGVQYLPTFILFKPNMQPVKAEGMRSKEDMKSMIEDVFFKTQHAENQ